MKTLTILLLFFICCSCVAQKKLFIKNVTIGNFLYSIYKETSYLHDDNMNASYFAVYKDKSNKRLCSSIISAKRNDSLFIEGDYKVYDKKIVFKEKYYFQKNNILPDSLLKFFYPNKGGSLMLVETIEFKNGKMTKVKY